MPNIIQLASKIDKVKVYAAGATVSRIADLHLENGETPEQVEISGLPLALDDSSVRVQVEGNANLVIPTDIRISLAVPSHPELPNSPAEEQLRQAKAEVRRIQETIALIDNEISVLKKLHVPNQPKAEPGKAPPPSPLAARLAIANFQDEQIRSRIQERRETQNSLKEAKTHLDELLHKQKLASTAQQVKPHELRKTVIISLSYPAQVTVSQQRLIVEYFVPGARWTPTYLCRLESSTNTAAIAVRAFLCQRTGEDWSGVRLELSTANPMTWCELPELPSLRLGRTQPVPRKSGWRLPPVGATMLFADYDRQKPQVVTVSEQFQNLESSSIDVSSVQELNLGGKQTVRENLQKNRTSTPRAFTQPPSKLNSSFYNRLLQLGYADKQQIEQARIESRKSGRPLTDIIESITGRQLSPDLIRHYKKQQLFELKTIYGVESLDPELSEISGHQVKELIESLIPLDICSRYRLVPLSKNDGQPPFVLVAMVDPDNLDAQDDLNRILRPQGIGLRRMVITQEDYQHLINHYRDQKLAQEKEQEAAKHTDISQDLDCLTSDAPEETECDLGEVLNEGSAGIINLVNRILIKALQEGVSDIHIEPHDPFLFVRFRKDGVLRPAFDPLPRKIKNAVANRVKIMANLDINKRLLQSGQFQRLFQRRMVNLFVEIIPARYGENIYMKVQKTVFGFSMEWIKNDIITYNLMRLPGADDANKRGKLLLQNQQYVYLELLKQQQFMVTFNVLEIVNQAISTSQECLSTPLPFGGVSVRDAAGSFDYAYPADGRVDVPSDGQFHSVALTSQSTDVNLRYIVVPREDTNVFRIVQLCNPLDAPLLSGSADVYVDGEYILSTTLPTVPAKGQVELGLGVEQGIKVARNTTYREVRSNQLLVAFNELRHHLTIDIANRLANEARIEIRERIPVPQEGEKVDVELGQVSPQWQKYEQEERGKPIQGGYRWRIKIPSQQQAKLSAQYTIKTYADSEVIGGNRRE
ncbi:MAG: mucoidy inhibitor MuiA family protein [Coleofasciculus sp. D1-CHI-01]|uniref:mucoidy inhibitor MuiA family protein n=1 Tax=Coleofasciculus sp. D1-CHI-01 TaxID=3068482 RepID=UPI0032FE9FA9